jgi:hypothetical protein
LTVPNFKSKFVGARWDRSFKQWQAQITINRKCQHLGYFDTEEEAARAFDEKAASIGRRVNFPRPGQTPAVKRGAHGIVSRYTGVCWELVNKKWQAHIVVDGKLTNLGHYISEEDAAQAYDERAATLGLPVNFPTEGQDQALKQGMSKFEGVHWNFDKNMWEAVGVKHGVRVPLGSFESEEEAARAVDGHEAARGKVRCNLPKEGELRQASLEKSSEFVGVFRKPKRKWWYSKINIDSKQTYLGNFGSEEEAARAYDERAAVLGKPVNFPEEGQKQAFKRGSLKASSKYRGVTKQGKTWRAKIVIDGKVTCLGTFDSEEAAARKFDEVAAPLGRAVNLPTVMGPLALL